MTDNMIHRAIFYIPQQKKESYTAEKLERCLEAIKKKEVASISAAAKLYNIPRTTMNMKILGHRPYEKRSRGPDPTLGK